MGNIVYHARREQIIVQTVGLNDYKNTKKYLENKGFVLVEESKLYDISNIVTLKFEKTI